MIMAELGTVITEKLDKRKPARCQLDVAEVSANSKPEEPGQVFNIWYSKWIGGENNGKRSFEHAKHRCNIKRDSGYTKADKYIDNGSINRTNYFCLYFARGYCCNGKNCNYLHRIPTELDIFSPTVDCFGREKFSDYRDDMSGIGSFERVNKTLYVGNIGNMEGNFEMEIYKTFNEFGDVDSVRMIPNKRIAFVKYKLESQAQFAKEAMFCQSLRPENKSETLNIRWANSDPVLQQNEKDDDDISIEAAKKILEYFKNETQNKKRNLEIRDQEDEVPAKSDEILYSSKKHDKNVHNIDKVPLDIHSLKKLSKRRQIKASNCGLVSGYSSSDEN